MTIRRNRNRAALAAAFLLSAAPAWCQEATAPGGANSFSGVGGVVEGAADRPSSGAVSPGNDTTKTAETTAAAPGAATTGLEAADSSAAAPSATTPTATAPSTPKQSGAPGSSTSSAPTGPGPGGGSAPGPNRSIGGAIGGSGGAPSASGFGVPGAGVPGAGGPGTGGPGTGPGPGGGYGLMPGMTGPGGGGTLSIGELLQRAMSRNPDILVADAKVRSAQAELDRVRLDVARQLIEAMQGIRHLRKTIEIARLQLQQTKESRQRVDALVKTGTASTTELIAADIAVRDADLALAKAEAMLETQQAALDYLTGSGTGVLGVMGGMGGMSGGGMMMGSPTGSGSGSLFNGFNPLGGGGEGSSSRLGGSPAATPGGEEQRGEGPNGGVNPKASANSARGATSAAGAAQSGGLLTLVTPTIVRSAKARNPYEELQRQMGEATTMDFESVPMADVMRYLSDLHGLNNYVIDKTADDGTELRQVEVTLKLDNVSLAAALKAIEDTAPVKFYVADYGIRVTGKATKLEEGIPLRTFLSKAPIGGTAPDARSLRTQ